MAINEPDGDDMGQGTLDVSFCTPFCCQWDYKFSILGNLTGSFDKQPGQTIWRIVAGADWLQSMIDDRTEEYQPTTLTDAHDLLLKILDDAATHARTIRQEMQDLPGIIGLQEPAVMQPRSSEPRR
jgi:hypothetical protein